MITVIIPVYNAEKFLEKCITSVLNQTYSDFEILLVNDGSKDNSLDLCKKLSEKNPKISFYNKENGGAASARNLGLDNAKGDYICFVDADDFLEPDYLSILHKNLTENNADLSMIGVNTVYKTGVEPRFILNHKVITSDFPEIEKLRAGVFSNRIPDFKTDYLGMGCPVDKLFKADIIKENHLRFNTSLVTGEDTFFSFQYFEYVKTFVYEPVALYNIFLSEDSLSRRFIPFSQFDETSTFFYKNAASGNFSPVITKALTYNTFRHYKSFLKRHFCSGNYEYRRNFLKRVSETKKILSTPQMGYVKKNLDKSILNKSEKIIFIAMKSPLLTALLQVLYR